MSFCTALSQVAKAAIDFEAGSVGAEKRLIVKREANMRTGYVELLCAEILHLDENTRSLVLRCVLDEVF